MVAATRRSAAARPERPGDSSQRNLEPGAIFGGIDLVGRKSVIVAVSGGGDSLSLLLLLARFLKARDSAAEPVAVTIDHRLRAEAVVEARYVGEVAAGLGVPHRVLAWDGAKPGTGVPAAAREARHRLLAQAAGEAGTDLVLTGHTLDDQAETVAMRRLRGGGRGEAGIAPATLFEGRCWFARPLLGTRRAALRAFLSECGQDWIDDPSNSDATYERARTRSQLTDAEVETLAAQATAAVRLRTSLGERAARVIAAHADMPVAGLVRLRRDFAVEADIEAAVYALRILLACVGGRAQLPDEARAAELYRRIAAVNFRATLSRSVIDSRKAGLFLHRELRGLPRAAPVSTGVWDGRYRIEGSRAGEIAPAAGGLAADGLDEQAAMAGVPQTLARAALAGRPALRSAGNSRLLEDDGASGVAALPLVAPWARYLPSFDIAPARTAAALLGAAAIPPVPFAGHIGIQA